VIFDKVEELHPWGKLLGDDIPTTTVLKHVLKRRRKTHTEIKKTA
jgi:hypothetical protein